MSVVRVVLELEGTLQGVGFRPTIARVVRSLGLSGSVRNEAGRVRLVLVGFAEAVDDFVAALPGYLPPRAELRSLRVLERSEQPELAATRAHFVIEESAGAGPLRISIPADLAMCGECRAEVLEPTSRFYGYPFTTCTSCGPRYTVVDGMPYDRERTTLRAFPLCPVCLAAYEDQGDRRYHAESMACPQCGPTLSLRTADGTESARAGQALRETRRILAEGGIVAVRGLGGFLLVVDARNRPALTRLRERKNRPHKPFAVCVRSLSVAQTLARPSEAEVRLLGDPSGPIVILELAARGETSSGTESVAFDILSPDTETLGVMLPTTPLHLLLLEALPGDPTPALDVLVMTSGNRGGEPICLTTDEALTRLAGIADVFLVHDRDINLRSDDSLLIVGPEGSQILRRARGFAPTALRLHRPLRRQVLAMGAQLKNTITLGSGHELVTSPHIGDLFSPEAQDSFELVAQTLPKFFGQQPEIVAVDLHPDMASTRLGRKIARALGVPVAPVQHHHAHAVACMVEHGLDEALALVFDGTGLGSDGSIWGAELLWVDQNGYVRLGTFADAPLPGGDQAVKHPARQLVARWLDAGIDVAPHWRERLDVGEEAIAIWKTQIERQLNTPRSHAAGRVFDAFSALCGLNHGPITYEGQAAIRLEALARKVTYTDGLPDLQFRVREAGDRIEVDWRDTFAILHERPLESSRVAEWAFSLHQAMANAAVCLAEYGRARTGAHRVVLAGGAFMNQLLIGRLCPWLRARGFEVFVSHLVPPNDGGVSVGQAAITGWA